MQVLKFGGTSVADSKNIDKVISIVKEAVLRDRTVVVSSAVSKCTDTLIEAAKLAADENSAYIQLINKLEERHLKIIEELLSGEFKDSAESRNRELFDELKNICGGIFMLGELTTSSLDNVMSYGELFSTSIISKKLSSIGVGNVLADSRKLVKTIAGVQQSTVERDSTERNIRALIDDSNSKLFILQGFIASDHSGRTTTLGRGGSDYTASLAAVALNARILEIWTDVNGMMTADPRIVPDARTIDNISYKEALELSHFGAKVVYPPTIQPVVSKRIPIYVKNTFEPENPGTLIENRPPEGAEKIKGISGSNNIALLSMEGSGMVGIPGYSSRLFEALARQGINIILITQASSVHTMCVAVDEADALSAKRAIDDVFAYEISLGKVEPLKVERGFSILSLVGDDLKNQSGTSGRMFDALGREGINIRAIAQGSSEKNVSTVVSREDVESAMRVIHNEFFGDNRKKINLFIAGFGNVGKSLVQILESKRAYFVEKYNKEIRIVGLCNSKGFVIDKRGVNTDNFVPKQGEIEDFCDNIINASLKDSVFIDCTASLKVSLKYVPLLENGVSVVTCNKTANSAEIELYREIRLAAKRGSSQFYYETNVGAALPVISTIEQMVNYGDKISKIEAVLSGTLNYLFSNYNGSESFASLVKKARELGYAEPDPRTDLSGTDVLRKALILSRELGYQTEASDISQREFLPEEVMSGTVEEFYSKLEAYETEILKLYKETEEEGKKLRYVATINDGVAEISLKKVETDSPLFNLKGTDNSVIITSEDYPSSITITGAGAGARQTASGILNDILKIN
jgi:aspartokinase/homoserine dehydrogenase 1